MSMIQASELAGRKFEGLRLSEPFHTLFGEIEQRVYCLIWGPAGSGKSTLTLALANDLAYNGPTLYVSAEEGQGKTLADRIKRLQATHPQLFIAEYTDLDGVRAQVIKHGIRFLILDSISQVDPESGAVARLKEWCDQHKVGLFIIAHALKDASSYKGPSELGHGTDIVVRVEAGKAATSKNRYKELAEIPVPFQAAAVKRRNPVPATMPELVSVVQSTWLEEYDQLSVTDLRKSIQRDTDLPGEVRNRHDGCQILVYRKGIGKSLSHGESRVQLVAMRHIKDLLKESVCLRTHTGPSVEIPYVHYYFGLIDFPGKGLHIAKLVVREHPNKENRQWDSQVVEIKKARGYLEHVAAGSESSGSVVSPSRASFKVSILQEEVNRLFPRSGKGDRINPKAHVDPYRINPGDLIGIDELFEEGDERENKAVSPDEIYQTVTDLILNTIRIKGHLPWQKEWADSAGALGREPMNWVSKKPYRGINYFLLAFEQKWVDGELVLVPRDLSNPWFLTFNQIEAAGAQLKKGSKGQMVMYFTRMYRYRQTTPKLEFGTADRDKFIAWLRANRAEIRALDSKSPEELADRSYVPVLKYYKVFNGADVEGIDWGITPTNPVVEFTPEQRIQVAEAIWDHYPQRPPLQHRTQRAFYVPSGDFINMPRPASFSEPQHYYCTLFHEGVHATGHKSRLNRDMTGRNGDKQYAFEELIAELGAVYLCSESGILFRTIGNSASYLASWNSRLVKNMKDDTRFFFRAASAAQAAADFILARNADGAPAYRADLDALIAESAKPRKVEEPKRAPRRRPVERPYEVAPLAAVRKEAERNDALLLDTIIDLKTELGDLAVDLKFKTAAQLRDAIGALAENRKRAVWLVPHGELHQAILKPHFYEDDLRFENMILGMYTQRVFTNGHVMISDPVAALPLLDRGIAREKARRMKRGRSAEQIDAEFAEAIAAGKGPNAASVIPKESGQPATCIGVIGSIPLPALIIKAGNKRVGFSADYLAEIAKHLPGSKMEVIDKKWTPAVFKRDHAIVGLLMPVALDSSLVKQDDDTKAMSGKRLERANPTQLSLILPGPGAKVNHKGQAPRVNSVGTRQEAVPTTVSTRANPGVLAFIGIAEELHTDQDTFKGRDYMFADHTGRTIYIVPAERVSRTQTAPNAPAATRMHETFKGYPANGYDFVITWPAGKPRRIGHATLIRYASDKIMEPGDRKGKVNHYYHEFDPGQRPVFELDDILIIRNLAIDRRGILN